MLLWVRLLLFRSRVLLFRGLFCCVHVWYALRREIPINPIHRINAPHLGIKPGGSQMARPGGSQMVNALEVIALN